ncbi:hypothetical protein E2C01_080902 [Portunus trituberculatus]|uniref:Uncharacterized protein n=1 Tax=Portunus trituberculatus TaxID=210409 RepID=A0A5B7IZL4_PORTR|nr:hypothetical protein [Portunus trituberculatus]
MGWVQNRQSCYVKLIKLSPKSLEKEGKIEPDPSMNRMREFGVMRRSSITCWHMSRLRAGGKKHVRGGEAVFSRLH